MPPDGDPRAARTRLHRRDAAEARAAFAQDAPTGLRTTPQQLFPKYFYDETGSELFGGLRRRTVAAGRLTGNPFNTR